MKFKILIFLLIAINIYAQTPPSGYTPNYKLRLWAQGARPSADSLNQNWKDIDSVIKFVENKVSIDTTYIAYINKSNVFTDRQNFDEIITSNIRIQNIKYFEIEDYEPPSAYIYFKLLTKPILKINYSGYDTVRIYSLYLGDNIEEVGAEITIIKDYREGFIRLMNENPLGSKTKFYFQNGLDLYLTNQGDMVTFICIQFGSDKRWVLKSKNF